MLVVSMNDFLSDPKQYMEKAQHTSVLVENEGEKPVKLSTRVPNIFKKIAEIFKPKPRKLGALRGQMKLEWVGDGKVTPEELFDDDDEDFLLSSKSEELKQG